MHALSMSHRTLAERCPQIHAKRLASLFAAVDAAMSGSVLALSALGRELPGPGSIKHNIKRIDRLLGNDKLHAELPLIYEALARQYLAQARMPLLMIDWSDLTRDRRWQLLRASVALAGRSMTVYEEVHPMAQAAAPAVHEAFLRQLAAILPSGCTPVLLTDAGFRGAWFVLVNRIGWHWIGRIRNRDMVRQADSQSWAGCKTLYAQATVRAQALGAHDYVRARPVPCHLVLVKRPSRARHMRSVHGQPVRSKQSLKNAASQKEPWLLAVCPTLAHLPAKSVVRLYAQRMQIEEAFRDLKSERHGLGLSANKSRSKTRLSVLLLIADMALLVLRWIGQLAAANQLAPGCQSNTRRSRAVLSVITLGRLLVRKKLDALFTAADFRSAQWALQQSCAELPV